MPILNNVFVVPYLKKTVLKKPIVAQALLIAVEGEKRLLKADGFYYYTYR